MNQSIELILLLDVLNIIFNVTIVMLIVILIFKRFK